MRHDLAIHSRFSQSASPRQPWAAGDPRAMGLAAVAAALKLQIDLLDPEMAEAVEHGAATLFLAGVGPLVAQSGGQKGVKARRPAARPSKVVLAS